jgi:hypothetical protein
MKKKMLYFKYNNYLPAVKAFVFSYIRLTTLQQTMLLINKNC